MGWDNPYEGRGGGVSKYISPSRESIEWLNNNCDEAGWKEARKRYNCLSQNIPAGETHRWNRGWRFGEFVSDFQVNACLFPEETSSVPLEWVKKTIQSEQQRREETAARYKAEQEKKAKIAALKAAGKPIPKSLR